MRGVAEREREKRAGGKKREAKERASLEILGYPEGMQMFGVHLEVCGREGGGGQWRFGNRALFNAYRSVFWI